MTRNEILSEINYQGVYNKEVKRKLNKLLKKYHPDNNKEDKETILILYEIKKELEKGSIEYKKVDIPSNLKKEDKTHIIFLEAILKRLKEEKEKINKQINALYNKLNKLGKDKNNKQEELYDVETTILDLNNEMEELIQIDILDKILLFFILFLGIILILLKNIIFIILIILFLVAELYYIYIRYVDYKNKEKKLKRINNKFQNINEEYNTIEENIEKLKVEETILKRERTKINNDITRYSKELNNIVENEKEKEEIYRRRK